MTTTTTPIVRCLLYIFFFVIIHICHGFRIPLSTSTAPDSSSTVLRLAKRNNRDDVVPAAATAATSNLLSIQQTQQLSRRQIGELSFAAVGLTTSFLGTRENTPQEYGLWGILPVGPYKRKKTITETIVPNTIWTFDQKVCT